MTLETPATESAANGASRGRPAVPAQMENPFWNHPLEEVLVELDAKREGLTSQEAAARLLRYGPNDATATKRPPSWLRFLRRFQSPLVIVLLLASVLSAITGDVASFVIVTSIVLLSVLMDFIQEMRAQNAVDALREKVALRAQVVRDGQETAILIADLVPGDVIHLAAGDMVPADGRLLSARDFFVNQALLTGEPYPVEKHAVELTDSTTELTAVTNSALAGTSVISGTAVLLVCRTGRATLFGQLADTLIMKPPPTAFETGLRRFSVLIVRITAILVLFVLTESMFFHRPWLESLLFALALAVGLTPELLPMIVTVTLARGAIRLADRRVIVKQLPAIHNLGAMDVLCTDKTGTLTEARIELMRYIDASSADNDRVLELAYLNSYFETGLKSPLDDAILERGKLDVSAWRKLDEVPFDFVRRRVSVLVEKGSTRLLIVKGAPEDVVRLSGSFEAADGTAQPLTPETRAGLVARYEQLCTEGFRVLGIATRSVPSDYVTAQVSDEAQMTFAGFAVFLDPPKSTAAQSIRDLCNRGVEVKILTGDNERVAAHLCGELGFAVTGTLTGSELAAMTEEALVARLARVNLFSRVTPQQKLRILLALKRTGQTVGFLGDGINDAPALHSADVGISVDSAADVAKAAAEIILLDKDLQVIEQGVGEGRRTVVNVDKYILMASSANFGNIISMALAGLFLPFLPLLPIQVLLTNLLYDFAQTGLPFDHVDPEAVERPVHWDIRLIERFMLVMGPISTVFDLITFAVLLFLFHAGIAFFRTGWFVESLVTQILMVFSVRTRRKLFLSRPQGVVTALALGAAVLTIAFPYLSVGRWFEFVHLPTPYFGFLVLALAGFLIMIEGVKQLFYARLLPGSQLKSSAECTPPRPTPLPSG
jgi:Mg2+-importing ATPase